MPGNDTPTVVCCRRCGDEYVLLTRDLDHVHAWGSREAMLQAGVPCQALDIADQSGSARLTSPPRPGQYPWFIEDIQHGDWYIDRARATEFCDSIAQAKALDAAEAATQEAAAEVVRL